MEGLIGDGGGGGDAEVFEEDAFDFVDGFGVFLDAVVGADGEFGFDAVDVGASVGDDAVGGVGDGAGAEGADDGMEGDAGVGLHGEEGEEDVVVGVEGFNAGWEAAKLASIEGVGVVFEELGEEVADLVGFGDEAGAEAADDVSAHVGASMGGGEEDDAFDVGLGLEEEVALELGEDVWGADDFRELAVGV